MKSVWEIVLKSMVIGGTMIVPGVSGGTMAIVLGIYDRLIWAVSSFRKNIKENLMFLLLFAVGAGCGFYLFTTPVSWLLENFEFPTICFFMIIVLCGIPVIGRKSGVQNINLEVISYLVLGAVLVVSISRLPGNGFLNIESMGIGSWFLLFLAGIASAVALILPGISFSHFLLILGLYDRLLKAIRAMDFGFLISLGAGVLIGTVLLSKVLDSFMKKYPRQTYLIILGFIIGSVAEVVVKYL